jgi:predicted ATPase
MLAVAKEHGFPFWRGWALVNGGWSSTALGRAQEGLELLTDGLSVIRSTGTVQCVPWVLTLLAEAPRKVGQSTKGLSCLAEAEAIIATTDEQCALAELHRLRGELLEAGGDQSAAEANYRRASMSLSSRAQKSSSCAPPPASPASGAIMAGVPKPVIYSRQSTAGFTEGFDTPVLKEARALLADLA